MALVTKLTQQSTLDRQVAELNGCHRGRHRLRARPGGASLKFG